MKPSSAYIATVVFILAAPPSASLAKGADKKCFETAYTQMEITDCSVIRAEGMRDEMQKRIDEIRHRISNRPQKLEAFERAQKAWEDYAQAEVDFLYIDHTGSAAPMCENDTAGYLIHQRIRQLDEQLSDNEQEDNLCAYSIVYDPAPLPEKSLYKSDK